MKQFIMWLVIILAAVSGTCADDAAEAGRRVWREHQAAVLTVKLVLNQSLSYSGRDQQSESKTETVGTVIDPSGLTVISLSAIDPSETMRSMLASRARGQSGDLQIDSQVKDARLVLADGTELAAEVVLRDKDLDVAFLRPVETPARPLPSLRLEADVKAQVLDQVICLNRLGQVANRTVAVSLERIDAVVERPRSFYLLGPGGSSGIGSPVFTLAGQPLGIILMRHVATEGEGNVTSMFSGTPALGILPIVVPAADILADVQQALESSQTKDR